MSKEISLENAIELQMLFGKHVVESYARMQDDETNMASHTPVKIDGDLYELSLRRVKEDRVEPTAYAGVEVDELVDIGETEDFETKGDFVLPLYSEKDLNRAGISISGGDHATEK